MSPPFPYIASAVRGSIRKPSPRDPSATPGCPHELPKHLSHQWDLPGKVGTKFMATPGMECGQPSISGMFAGALGFIGGGGWC